MAFSISNIGAITLAAIITMQTATADTPALDCGGQQYKTHQGTLGGSAEHLVAGEWRDFCVSSSPDTIRQSLTVKGDEVWCITNHHITADTAAYARETWLLNLEIKVLQVKQYIRDGNGWRKHAQDRIRCDLLAE